MVGGKPSRAEIDERPPEKFIICSAIARHQIQIGPRRKRSAQIKRTPLRRPCLVCHKFPFLAHFRRARANTKRRRGNTNKRNHLNLTCARTSSRYARAKRALAAHCFCTKLKRSLSILIECVGPIPLTGSGGRVRPKPGSFAPAAGLEMAADGPPEAHNQKQTLSRLCAPIWPEGGLPREAANQITLRSAPTWRSLSRLRPAPLDVGCLVLPGSLARRIGRQTVAGLETSCRSWSAMIQSSRSQAPLGLFASLEAVIAHQSAALLH